MNDYILKLAAAAAVGFAAGFAACKAVGCLKDRRDEDEYQESADNFVRDFDQMLEIDEDLVGHEFERFAKIQQRYSSVTETAEDLLDKEPDDVSKLEAEVDVTFIEKAEYDEDNGYSKRSVTYFAKDDVLAEGNGLAEMGLDDIRDTVGEELFDRLQEFDWDNLYVRNDKTYTDVEVKVEKELDYVDAISDTEDADGD